MLCVVHPRFVAQNVFRCCAVYSYRVLQSLKTAFFVVARGAQAMLIIIVAVTGQNDAASTLWDL